MKKKLFVLIVALSLLLACALTFNACRNDETPRDTDKTEPNTSVVELSNECVFLAGYSADYDGKAKTPAVIIKYKGEVYAELTASNAEFDIIYANNVSVGTGSVTVTSKEGNTKFKGTVTLNITVRATQKQIETYSDLKEALESANYSTVMLSTNITVDEGQTLTIPEGKSIYLDNGNKNIEFINNGIVENHGTFCMSRNGATNEVKIVNNGIIINKGCIFVYGGATFFNLKTVNNTGKFAIKEFGTVYSNGVISNAETEPFACYYRRGNLADDAYTVTLPYVEVNYNERAFTPTVIVTERFTLIEDTDYTLSYENNVNVGTATVIVTAKETSRKVYGEKRAMFIINPVKKIVNKIGDLQTAFANDNYKEITAIGVIIDQITVSDGCALTLKGNTYVTGQINVNGTLKNEGNLYINGSLTNNGSMINSGKVYFKDENGLSGSTISNTGTVYANGTLTQVTSGLVVRSKFTSADYSFESDVLSYNSAINKPDVVFNIGAIDEATYRIGYFTDTHVAVVEPKEVGLYYAKIIFGVNSEQYYGSAERAFSIIAGSKTVETATDFNKAIADTGYSEIKVNSEITTEEDIITVNMGATLTITADGTLIVIKRLVNNGIVANAGKLVIGYYTDTSKATVAGIFVNNGTVNNSGEVYVNKDMTEGISLDGTVYIRKDVGTMTCTLADYYPVYTEVMIAPAFTVTDGEIPINGGNFQTFCDRRPLDVGVVRMTVKAYQTSQCAYGESHVDFEVKPGTTTVTNLSELSVALSNMSTKNPAICNWSTIIVGADIYSINENLTVASNTTLNCENYMVSTTYPVKITNKGIVLIKNKTLGSLTLVNSGNGKVVAYVTSYDELCNVMNVTRPADVIYLATDILVETVELDFSYQDIVIDLRGHVLGKKVAVDLYGSNKLTIKSSVEGGKIGDGTYSKSLIIDYVSGGYCNVRLENLCVNGMTLGPGVSPEQVTIVNCKGI